MVLQKVIVDDDDPGILIDWNTDILEQFVAFANGGAGVPTQPPWITTAVGGMSMATLTSDIVAYAATLGGGRTGRVQGCLNALPEAQPIATLSVINDRKIAAAVPLAFAPPPPGVVRAFL